MLATIGDEIQRVTQQIAVTLGETHHGPVEQIERFVRLLGVECAQTVLRETLAVVAAWSVASSSTWLASA